MLDSSRAADLAGELLSLCEKLNTAVDGTLVVPSAWLEVVAMRR